MNKTLNLKQLKGKKDVPYEDPHKSVRPFGVPTAPTYYPTKDEFKDPYEYMAKIRAEAEQYGIIKIVPPSTWNPKCVIDSGSFKFTARTQSLNMIGAATRAALDYMERLANFHKLSGSEMRDIPSTSSNKLLNVYQLKNCVSAHAGGVLGMQQGDWERLSKQLDLEILPHSNGQYLRSFYLDTIQPYEQYLENDSRSKRDKEKASEAKNKKEDTKIKMEHMRLATPSNSPESDYKEFQTPVQQIIQYGDDINPPTPLSAFLKVEKPQSDSVTMRMRGKRKREAEVEIASLRRSSRLREASEEAALEETTQAADPFSEQRKKFLAQRQTLHSTQPKTLLSIEDMDVQDSESESEEEEDEHDEGYENGEKEEEHSHDESLEGPSFVCEKCEQTDPFDQLAVCHSCMESFHIGCLDTPLAQVPEKWFCVRCVVGDGSFTFEQSSKKWTLAEFKKRADKFERQFAQQMKLPKDVAADPQEYESWVESQYWRLVNSIDETVTVEYGADIHVDKVGSGFPVASTDPYNRYSKDPWNLNVLPLRKESLLRHVQNEISGVTVPWLYVGMMFSTFCWHCEDHYTYSANYQHLGATKTWYGIPGADALKFEAALRANVPDLMEKQPNLMFQLVTMLNPETLLKFGVRVYAVDQKPGQFVVTYPRAYHGGFNQGFNVNEAVNFAPPDWVDWGTESVKVYKKFHKPPVFSHDELLLKVATTKLTADTATWLAPHIKAMVEAEATRVDLFRTETRRMGVSVREIRTGDLEEDAYCCKKCETLCYLSHLVEKTKDAETVYCYDHWELADMSKATLRVRLEVSEIQDIYRDVLEVKG